MHEPAVVPASTCCPARHPPTHFRFIADVCAINMALYDRSPRLSVEDDAYALTLRPALTAVAVYSTLAQQGLNPLSAEPAFWSVVGGRKINTVNIVIIFNTVCLAVEETYKGCDRYEWRDHPAGRWSCHCNVEVFAPSFLIEYKAERMSLPHALLPCSSLAGSTRRLSLISSSTSSRRGTRPSTLSWN